MHINISFVIHDLAAIKEHLLKNFEAERLRLITAGNFVYGVLAVR